MGMSNEDVMCECVRGVKSESVKGVSVMGVRSKGVQ